MKRHPGVPLEAQAAFDAKSDPARAAAAQVAAAMERPVRHLWKSNAGGNGWSNTWCQQKMLGRQMVGSTVNTNCRECLDAALAARAAGEEVP